VYFESLNAVKASQLLLAWQRLSSTFLLSELSRDLAC
jgi:hypothetical protein